MDKSIVFIVNPIAKNGDMTRLWFSILRHKLLNSYKNSKEYIIDKPNDAKMFTITAINNNCNMIVILGDDATYNEVINGYMDVNGKDKGVILVILPIETDLSRTLYKNKIYSLSDIFGSLFVKSKKDEFYDYVCGIIDSETNIITDIGTVTLITADGNDTMKKYFINCCAIGFSAEVNRDNSGWNISFSKINNVCKQLSNFTNKPIQFKLDNNDEWFESTVYQMIVANGNYSDNVCISPQSNINDGKLDLVSFDKVGITDISILKDIYFGKHLDNEKTKIFSAKKITIKPQNNNDDLYIDIDGTQGGKLPAIWSIIPDSAIFNYYKPYEII